MSCGLLLLPTSLMHAVTYLGDYSLTHNFQFFVCFVSKMWYMYLWFHATYLYYITLTDRNILWQFFLLRYSDLVNSLSGSHGVSRFVYLLYISRRHTPYHSLVAVTRVLRLSISIPSLPKTWFLLFCSLHSTSSCATYYFPLNKNKNIYLCHVFECHSTATSCT